MSTSTTILRRAVTSSLEGFAKLAGGADGVNIRALAPFTSLLVRTKNSTYQISVQGGTAAVVQGGQFFPTATAVDLCGATLGSSLIRPGWIGVGLCLEFIAGGRRVVTTRVSTIGIQSSPGGPRIH